MVNFKLIIDFKVLVNNIMVVYVFCSLDIYVNVFKENLEILNYFILDKKKIFKVILVFLKNLCMFDDFI